MIGRTNRASPGYSNIQANIFEDSEHGRKWYTCLDGYRLGDIHDSRYGKLSDCRNMKVSLSQVLSRLTTRACPIKYYSDLHTPSFSDVSVLHHCPDRPASRQN